MWHGGIDPDDLDFDLLDYKFTIVYLDTNVFWNKDKRRSQGFSLGSKSEHSFITIN